MLKAVRPCYCWVLSKALARQNAAVPSYRDRRHGLQLQPCVGRCAQHAKRDILVTMEAHWVSGKQSVRRMGLFVIVSHCDKAFVLLAEASPACKGPSEGPGMWGCVHWLHVKPASSRAVLLRLGYMFARRR